MHTIQFKREINYQQNEYCILEFKGKFESDSDDPQNQQKSMITLGELKKIVTDQGKYKLEIGIMDLIGKEVKLTTKQLVTQTITGNHNNQKIILIKGIVNKKIVFQNRPAPDMQRILISHKQGTNHKMFSKVDQRHLAQESNKDTNTKQDQQQRHLYQS